MMNWGDLKLTERWLIAQLVVCGRISYYDLQEINEMDKNSRIKALNTLITDDWLENIDVIDIEEIDESGGEIQVKML